MTEHGPIDVKSKTGEESFTENGQKLNFDLKSFWRWSMSDLVSNTTRGVLAEYIVARALGINLKEPRNEWDSFDLKTSSGTKVEVKSAAYIQSWYQKKHSTISFRIPKTTAWDANTNTYKGKKKRQAKVYVFALLSHEDQATIDPLDISQWEFYVVPTKTLNKKRKEKASISLSQIKELGFKADPYKELKTAVERASKK